MMHRWILAATFAITCTARAEQQTKPMGEARFQRLQDPKTRIEALYEFENAGRKKSAAPEDPEKFAAEQWKQTNSSTFLVSSLPAGELGRGIAITHEIDQIRSVPKTPFAPDKSQDAGH